MSDIEKSDSFTENVSEETTLKLGTTKYRDSQSSADDNKSSGWVLIIVGVIGIIAVILGMVGVIPFKFSNSYLFYGVFCAIFVLFLVMGAVSFANAKKFEHKAKGENSLRDNLIDWTSKNITAEVIDEKIENSDNAGEEILYFMRVKVLTDMLNKQFVNLDPDFLENLIDQTLYENIFGESEYYAEEDDFEENDSDEDESDVDPDEDPEEESDFDEDSDTEED
ncbi:MAG: hypothetical protein MJ104_06275 [Lachnospiraceae bacterium]|nr:hypothetical protein [Lachnospiraceae bacterium]